MANLTIESFGKVLGMTSERSQEITALIGQATAQAIVEKIEAPVLTKRLAAIGNTIEEGVFIGFAMSAIARL